jgi:tetratricopeptide (TPR) repeat protein
VNDVPNSAEAHDALGTAYLVLGDLDSAQAEFDIAITLNPELTRTYVNMGRLMEARNELSIALWYYQQAVILEPDGQYAEVAQRAADRIERGN